MAGMPPEDPNNNNPVGEVQPTPQQMYYTRPLEPQQPVMSEQVRQKHEESKQRYPKLNLSEGEYVISDVKRHPIGLVQIWTFVTVAVAAIMAVMAVFLMSDMFTSSAIPTVAVAGAALLLSCLVLFGGYIGTYVYTANKFYLTNESVIQNIQMGVFSNREQTVSLSNIEDASYVKRGIIQNMFDFGTIRLSTQGDETTYRFYYAAHPDKQIAILNNAVEDFKNGRPIRHE
jgi:uncharacterized membrane protein YdbT with pleckstrin-like domain